jgi:enediyne biosynthesis protein E3
VTRLRSSVGPSVIFRQSDFLARPAPAAVGWLFRAVLGIPEEETSFARRGFAACDPEVQRHLERIGRSFVTGYHAALRDRRPQAIAAEMRRLNAECSGFGFEGAAMALTMLDELVPWRRNRLATLLRGAGAAHVYMVHVGAGWALARLRRDVTAALRRLDPVLGWLAVDGYGFHEGYFRPGRTTIEHRRPSRLTGYALSAFDQGLGRSLWFVCGADPERIAQTIDGFAPPRRADLWSGVGVASTYAGGVDGTVLKQLLQPAAHNRPALAQGAAFAAEARARAGNLVPHTTIACELLAGMTAPDAAALVREVRARLPYTSPMPLYEVWRHRVQAHFAARLAETQAASRG